MKNLKLMTTFFCAVIAIAMAFSAMVTISANAEEDTRQLVKLDAYEDAVIPNGYEHNDEYSKYDTDASKRLDVGLRAPGNGGYMDGDPLTNPGAPYGNGVNVAQGIAKYKIKYGGGAVRLRYGYTVDLSDTNINLRILSTDGVTDTSILRSVTITWLFLTTRLPLTVSFSIFIKTMQQLSSPLLFPLHTEAP